MPFAAIWPSAIASNFGSKLQNKCSGKNQDRVIGEIAKNTRDIAKTLAPHGATGNLARSLYARKISNGVWEVGSPLDYAWAVEFGSGIFSEGPMASKKVIEPVKSDYLAFKIEGRWIRVRYVLGQHPQPFLRPAIERVNSDKAFKTIFGEK
jgi:hypothetical protein